MSANQDDGASAVVAVAMEPMKPPVVPSLPADFHLWRAEIDEAHKLQMVSTDQFSMDGFLATLGASDVSRLGALGLTDPDEIRARLDLMCYLIDNVSLREFLTTQQEIFMTPIPSEHEHFIETYSGPGGQINYWEKMRDFIRLCREYPGPMPARLETFVANLEARLPLADSERQMADAVIVEIETMATIEGCATFKIERENSGRLLRSHELDLKELNVFGQQSYSNAVSQIQKPNYPRWTFNRRNPLNWFGVGRMVREKMNEEYGSRRTKALQSMAITEDRGCIKHDLRSALAKVLISDPWKQLNLQRNESIISVHFVYNNKGLNLRIVFFGLGRDYSFSNFECGNPCLTPDQLQRYRAARAMVGEWNLARNRAYDMALTILNAGEFDRELLGVRLSAIKVDSPSMDSAYRWFALSNLLEGERFSTVYKTLLSHRSFFAGHFNMLANVARVARNLSSLAQNLNTGICDVELVEDGRNVVQFDQIIPTHLLAEVKDWEKIVPISGLPSINGQLVGLTGYHGGGKTTAGLSIANIVYSVQSGIPPLGHGIWRQNVKHLLGVVSVDRGRGSTSQRLLEKMTNVLGALGKVSREDAMLVVDELGTGTQEDAGQELGFDLLQGLATAGISTIFSTQIQGLAKQAETELGAVCFKVGPDHQITPGIGDGGMRELRKTSGFDTNLRALAKNG